MFSRIAKRSISITKSSEVTLPFIPLVSNNGLPGAIGNTPLIKLNKLSERTGRNIFAKAEYMNPGGSIKDRAALYVIKDAIAKGLRSGGTIIEGTAGNTGIGLAHVARSLGFDVVIYMPNTQAQLKIDTLRLLGCEVHPVPVVPFDNPENYNHQAKRHADRLNAESTSKTGDDIETSSTDETLVSSHDDSLLTETHGNVSASSSGLNAVWTNQFDNLANTQSHVETTGPEIWAQLNGQVDAFTCSTGTGGTLAGITKYLKDISNGKTLSILADPPGSVLYSYIKSNGKEVIRGGSSFTEGIGQGRVTENMGSAIDLIDDALKIPDEESISMVYQLLHEEGLYLGGTGALNVVAAEKVAKTLPEGSNVVTILADSAHKYADRYFSRKWLESKNLYDAIPKELKKYVILD